MTDTICLIDAPRFASVPQQGHVRFLIDVRSPAGIRAQHPAATDPSLRDRRQQVRSHGLDLLAGAFAA